MNTLDAGGRWCPQCGAEYRPAFDTCADCGVALVTERPSPVARDGDHEVVEYDLADWPAERRTRVELVLRGAEIPQVWDSGRLVVPHSHEAEVDAVVDEAKAVPATGTLQDEPDTTPPPSVDAPDSPALAEPGRRLAGYVVDSIILGLVWLWTYVGVFHRDRQAVAPQLVLTAWVALYHIVPVALRGRTPGKVAAGTKIVGAADHAVPGWRRAAIRWVVPAGPGLLVLLVPPLDRALGPLELVWTIAVYLPITSSPVRQGLHDRAAATLVVLAEDRTPARAGHR
ncbi:MAG TPA: RDD family protein [Acidimicrobiales bacterium]|nr:RDD family protein [Acidimicrobiales bacterium]